MVPEQSAGRWPQSPCPQWQSFCACPRRQRLTSCRCSLVVRSRRENECSSSHRVRPVCAHRHLATRQFCAMPVGSWLPTGEMQVGNQCLPSGIGSGCEFLWVVPLLSGMLCPFGQGVSSSLPQASARMSGCPSHASVWVVGGPECLLSSTTCILHFARRRT